MTKNCLTLIGMPASGKSSVGVVLAKKTGRRFIDGDLLIQEQSGKLLKDLIAERGDDGFRALEDETLAALETENAVIAPGGSVIYGEKAMARLRALGKVIYLKLSYPAIRRRLGDLTARGVSIKEGQSLRDLYRERTVLYEKYADLVIDETDHPLIINCSPVGMAPGIDQAPHLPYTTLSSQHLLYDLIYNPEETRFLSLGRQYGATIKNGLEMLHRQALAAWDIWQST